MRNLLVYPITEEEVLRNLKDSRERILGQLAYGDTRSISLDYAMDFIKENPYAFHLFLSRQAPETPKETKPIVDSGDKKAKSAYDKSTENDPVIHTNRFASWEDLPESAKDSWRDQVRLSV